MRHVIPRNIRELSQLQGDMNDVFQKLFDRFSHFGWTSDMAVTPSIDLSETQDDVIVQAEIPGVDIHELGISLVGKILTITGKKNREKESEEESIHHLERSFGAFSRKIGLPCEVVQDKTEATYEKGVLTIKLPKCEKAKTTRIRIKQGRAS